MLKDAALRAARPAARRARARPRAQGLDALQRPVPGRHAGVRGRRLLRAHPRRRALGRLPPVLHALPLPAAAAVGEGRAVPALAARLDRRHHAGADARAVSFRDRFRKGLFTNVFLHAKLEERYADRPDQVKQEVKRVLQEGAVRGQRAQDAQAGRAARVEPARGRLDRLRRAQHLHRRRRPAQGRVRARGGHGTGLEPRLGHRREQRALLAHRRRGGEDRGGRRRRPGSRRAALPRPARGGQRADPHAHDEPGRPLAGARLARARAQVAARARQARPRAGARADPPRGHQRQRAGEGVRRLAGLARLARS